MIAELGHFALVLALLLALVLGVVPLAGAHRGAERAMAVARPAALGQALLLLLAWGCLVASFVQNDFSVRNVAENSTSLLPLPYRIAASWGSHEGSMLLWLVLQSVWMLALAGSCRHLPPEVVARVLALMGLLSSGLTLFVLTTSNPFLRMFPIPAQGRDLNPLLQDPGMVLHPPLLYMGYVGFSVAFCFALAALLGGRPDGAWARWARPWTIAAWCFLTAGVALGSWWAYNELGWGGWWFWDPVENAALMPWLVGTALLHGLAVSERRGLFQAWTVLLAVGCFSLSLLGTFLVRSGVLTSVHAFAIDPRRGSFMLLFLLLVIGGSLALFMLRAPRGAAAQPTVALSRETLLLANTLLLSVAAASVLLGTLYPLVLEAFNLGKISVGAPFFDAVIVPLMAPAVFLMGLAPVARWHGAPLPALWTRLQWVLVLSALLGLTLPFVWGRWSALTALGLFLASWLALATAAAVFRGHSGGAHPLPVRWGMIVAHLGMAVFIVGVTVVRSYEVEADLLLAPGQSAVVGKHVLTFEGTTQLQGPNYRAVRASVDLAQGGRSLGKLYPEKRSYASMPATPMTEAAIASSLWGDVYVALGQDTGQGVWTLRAYHKPFLTWIWGGCGLMLLGGLLVGAERRYRVARRTVLAKAVLSAH